MVSVLRVSTEKSSSIETFGMQGSELGQLNMMSLDGDVYHILCFISMIIAKFCD